MEAAQLMTKMTPCTQPLPDLEVPMINAIVTCLGSEHEKLNSLITRLALAATRPVDLREPVAAIRAALEIWEEIRRSLRSHLQIEDELVFSWGEAHHAISETLIANLKDERQKMRKLIADLQALTCKPDNEKESVIDQRGFAKTLLVLAGMLDSHVERYDGEVLPAIRRALFHH